MPPADFRGFAAIRRCRRLIAGLALMMPPPAVFAVAATLSMIMADFPDVSY